MQRLKRRVLQSVVNGVTYIEKQRWDAFSEEITLIASGEKYRARHGVYRPIIIVGTTARWNPALPPGF